MIKIYANKRLAFYGKRGDDPGFWSNHWAGTDWREWLDAAKGGGGLGYFEKPFSTYLPKHGKMLEAGCGVGQFVVALRARGYDVEGVEFSEETVSMVRQYLNDCPIRVGDVRNLDYPDNHFSAYISLGVMEHFEEGPHVLLNEAYRVLKDEGYLFVSVPRIHPIRQLKAWLGFYLRRAKGEFYQYAFRPRDFLALLEENNFAIQETCYYGSFKGIKDQFPPLNYLWKKGRVPPRMITWVETNSFLNRLASHMVLFVGKKVART